MAEACKQLRALEEGISDLTQHYIELKNQERERHNKKATRLTDRQIQTLRSKSQAEKKWQEHVREIENESHRAQQTYREQRADDVDQLKEQITKARLQPIISCPPKMKPWRWTGITFPSK